MKCNIFKAPNLKIIKSENNSFVSNMNYAIETNLYKSPTAPTRIFPAVAEAVISL